MEILSDKTVRGRTRLAANGRIVIPAAIREALGLKPGEVLALEAEGDVLRIESFSRKLKKIQDEIIRFVGPDRSLADELIAERQEEARREAEEADRERPDAGTELKRAV